MSNFTVIPALNLKGGVVVHAGSAVTASSKPEAMKQVRENLLPLLDEIDDEGPDVLIEASAGAGQSLAATVDELGLFLHALDEHPRLGFCLDTCHAFAAGHDIAAPGGVRSTLNALVRAVGRGRLKLIHANDSKDACGSNRDNHERIGKGKIGVRALVVGPLALDDQRQALEARLRQECRAPPFAELALPDVRVTVSVGAERRLRVVEVQRLEPFQAHDGVEPVQRVGQPRRGPDVVARGQQMARVQADAEPLARACGIRAV